MDERNPHYGVIHQCLPGNGCLYEVGIFAHPTGAVLVLVNFGRCMRWFGMPSEPSYLAEKLDISDTDAEAIFDLLERIEG